MYNGENDVPEGYSVINHVIENGRTLAGNQEIPTHDNENIMIGNTGNGYAQITIIEAEYRQTEYFPTLTDAINSCTNENKGYADKVTILKDLKETNTIDNEKNILLQLSGHTVSYDLNNPVLTLNNAKLKIIGKGNITNTYKYEFVEETQDHDKIDGGIGIYLTENAELTLGEDDRSVNRDIKIFGYGAGIYKNKQTESILNFYDGEVSGIKSIIGSVDKTAKNCNVITDLDEETNILTTYLGIVEDPVARIGNVYYGTLEKALEDVPETEEYEMKTIDTRLIPENFVGDDTYFFYKEGDKLVPNNSGINSTTAHSYMKIDLSESLPEEYKLTIDASISSQRVDRGIVMITNSSDTPIIDSNKSLIYTDCLLYTSPSPRD